MLPGPRRTMTSLEEEPATEIEQNIWLFLKSHPDFLERFVIKEVDVQLLNRWWARKSQKTPESSNTSSTTTSSRRKFCVHADERIVVGNATASLRDSPPETKVLAEISKCIASTIDADGHSLYLDTSTGLAPCLQDDAKAKRGDEKGRLIMKMVESAAKSRHAIRTTATAYRDSEDFGQDEELRHSLFQAVTSDEGKVIGVVHFWRCGQERPFFQEDEEIVSSYLGWDGLALHYARLHGSVLTQRRLQEFLLQVVRAIFQDMINMDAVVAKIIDFAQDLVEADRASLFLIDSEKNELYARLFDFGISETEGGQPSTKCQFRDLRFPADAGIAGYVAKTGRPLNITDAYSDPRFNRSIDQMTGYRTNSILCMPIFQAPEMVIGVVEMVNKKSGPFTKEDEKAFEMFAVYCGLALHHARLFEAINKSEQKYKVAVEVLSYHSTCTESEVQQVVPVPEKLDGLDRFDLNYLLVNDVDKAKQTICMFNDLFGFGNFDLNSIIRFTLTVRKNYRRVPYHNWTHGFGVANSMYAILKHSPTLFTHNERLALFIGALCHDLDHRGKNNKFMIESASPLANIYTTSTMEHHHFNQTVAILQQDGHNILENLNGEEYRQVLNIIKHCILATDLATFFSNKDDLSRILAQGDFSPNDPHHRSLILAVAMTGSDLSASAKPWQVQLETVRVIFEEFYDQGDEERAAGRQPVPMMDRNQPGRQAPSQVDFLTQICVPCYQLLAQVVPGASPMLRGCLKNLQRWTRLCEAEDADEALLTSSRAAPIALPSPL